MAKKNFTIETRGVKPPCPLPKFDYPVTQKENYKLCMEHKLPYWVPMKDIDNGMTFNHADNDRPFFGTSGTDWFGVKWDYVDVVGGQTVAPGPRLMDDPCDWREKMIFPDLSKVDFSVGVEEEKARLALPENKDKIIGYVMQDGLWERLMSICPESEAFAFILEEPEEAKAFFDRMADYKIEMIEKLVNEWAPFDLLINSDDWGTQLSTFMSPESYRELILPGMKRIAECVHKHGLYWDCHSCGKTETLVPYMIELGFNFWEAQSMNDLKAVKAKYGKDIVIHATLDPWILQDPDVTEEQLRNHVRQVIDDLGEGGGLILAFKCLTPFVYETVTTEIYNYSSAKYAAERAKLGL